MECRLSQSARPWHCQLSLRFEFDDAGRRRDEVKEVPFGPPITDNGDVELAIRRAQAAVLNPAIPYDQFLTFTADDIRDGKALHGSSSLAFSKNVVCLDISGPDVTDLAFVDLPGQLWNLVVFDLTILIGLRGTRHYTKRDG
jgi:hypothetical protein